MKEYRLKNTVKAAQWEKYGDVPQVHVQDLEGEWICQKCGHEAWRHGNVRTTSGWQIVCPGDYIMLSNFGFASVVSKERFEHEYELAQEPCGWSVK